ncbi:unnamed protein product [marine sediment metagenome]|uniref:Methyltransferase domain-containing protein n=1 Tax=marine sediment metagenome TaxID=412755 RepID=X0Z447_9ZZZZ
MSKMAVERERAYWDDRYASGYISGRTLVRERLWAAIEEELPEVDHIIDVGCGDLRIWGERDCQDYVGIDISMQVLQDNKKKRPHWDFICSPAETFLSGLVRENVFCFNLIYHILDPENVRMVLRNLCRYARKRIFIYTMIINPFFPEVTDGKYQYYHPMEQYVPAFEEMGFTLTSIELMELRYDINRYGAPSGLYIFKSTSCSL